MTIQAEIKAIESLAEIDAELTELTSQLNEERGALESKKSLLAELEGRIGENQNSVSEMERMRGDLIAEVRQMSIQVEKSREKLSRCRTEREANAAQREVEELRKLYRDRELEIEKLSGLVEQARAEIEKVDGERGVLASELDANEGDIATSIGRLNEELSERSTRREALVKQVPTPLYRKYELVRKRRGSAIASTTDGTCSECHMALPPMLFQQLRRGEKFDQCPSCQRILYFRHPQNEELEQAEAESRGSSSDKSLGTDTQTGEA